VKSRDAMHQPVGGFKAGNTRHLDGNDRSAHPANGWSQSKGEHLAMDDRADSNLELEVGFVASCKPTLSLMWCAVVEPSKRTSAVFLTLSNRFCIASSVSIPLSPGPPPHSLISCSIAPASRIAGLISIQVAKFASAAAALAHVRSGVVS
jgi:hypothetical protein